MIKNFNDYLNEELNEDELKEKSEIQNGNKLIHKFMGFPETNLNTYKNYNTDWNCLIDVIKKCKELDEHEYRKNIKIRLLSLDIKELWKSVVNFIIWYNKYIT